MPDEFVSAPAGGLPCWLPGCGSAVGVQWQRRLTVEELAALGPAAPAAGDVTRVVHGCMVHAIELELAARVHQASCVAPGLEVLPSCACKPEPLPVPATDMDLPTVTLPSGWTVPVS